MIGKLGHGWRDHLGANRVVSQRREHLRATAEGHARIDTGVRAIPVPSALAALALWRRSTRWGRVLRVLLVSCCVLFGIRFLPGWMLDQRTPESGATVIGVTSWNLELGQADPARIVDGLRPARAGFIGLVELTPQHAGPISADPDLSA